MEPKPIPYKIRDFYKNADSWAARPDVKKEKACIAMVQDLHSKMKLKGSPPDLYIVDTLALNATADKRENVVAITKGALDNLSPDAQKAIIGHELAHFQQNNPLMAVKSLATAAAVRETIDYTALHATFLTSIKDTTAAVAGFAAWNIIRRHNEYKSDKKSDEVVGNNAMAEGLQAIKDQEDFIQSFIKSKELGGIKHKLTHIMDTVTSPPHHPPLAKRIDKLNKTRTP